MKDGLSVEEQPLTLEEGSPSFQYAWREAKESHFAGLKRIAVNILIYGLPMACLTLMLSSYGHKSAPISTSISLAVDLDPAYDRFLTDQQCQATYPDLDQDAKRGSSFWLSRGGIKEEHLSEAMNRIGHDATHVVIIDNKLYVRERETKAGNRDLATLALLNEALVTSTERLPNVEFVFSTWDCAHVIDFPFMGLAREVDQQPPFLLPDFGFYAWPETKNSFLEVAEKARIRESAMQWKDKIPKLLFRGAFWVHPVRQKLYDVASRHPDWNDVSDLDWLHGDDRVLSMDEHCKWQFLAHAEGTAYSGRYKYLTQCRSVIVTHKPKYVQHFSHLRNADPDSPDQNLVELDDTNWNGLEDVMQRLLKDDQAAERIANNSYAHFRHWLNPASTNCYWRSLIRLYAAAQTFKPTWKPDSDVPYSSYSMMRMTDWHDH